MERADILIDNRKAGYLANSLNPDKEQYNQFVVQARVSSAKKQNNTIDDDEIDLAELFYGLLAHQFFIGSCTALAIFCAGSRELGSQTHLSFRTVIAA